ncbi:hypothetical protein OCU04_012914 [Sclerotinia nivalis]|uniref:CENP-V/GFA domain-containing protein n=1 Tax=Sclerotinia nivalis TaxID=352851 RepID=A0A9X0A884_9HELO|nr:hypothetical protein OCU04_012914 [Sclerotinia nivalis]
MCYTGSCYCRAIKYTFNIESSEARTSLCHCHNCKKFFGTNYGLTTKIPALSFKIIEGEPKVHEADNGSGSLLHREFCGVCGGGILEYGEQAKEHFRYVMYGTIDKPEGLDPKGEFFCKYREKWMPEIEGKISSFRLYKCEVNVNV